jgi:hypothetical protein
VSIFAIIGEALRIARTHKSLWLFGFLAGAGVGFTNGGGGGGGGPAGVPGAVAGNPGLVAVLVLLGLAVLAGLVILKLVSAGALIQGVQRARGNAAFTWREGFREGWAHWGVLLRIALVYLLLGPGSAILLFCSCWLVGQAFGMTAMLAAGAVGAVVGIPWLVTLHIWQSFAERIAVLENRRALDAIAKARLFLHGRLQHGLKLFVAEVLGTLLVGAVGFVVLAPFILLLRASVGLWGMLPAIAVGLAVVLPTAFVAISMVGILGSSVWTIGYLKQVER